jgi:hypothetical protein
MSEEAPPAEPRHLAGVRPWLVAVTVVDALLFLAAAYMAVGALDVAVTARGSDIANAIAALFLALPVFCVAAPLAAWRAFHRSKSLTRIVFLMLAPLIYALFLTLFLASA